MDGWACLANVAMKPQRGYTYHGVTLELDEKTILETYLLLFAFVATLARTLLGEFWIRSVSLFFCHCF